MECGEKQKIFIVAMDKTGRAYPKEIYIDDGISPEVYLENHRIGHFDWGYTYEYMADMAEAVNRNHNNEPLGKSLKCKQCGKYYYMTLSNIAWYKEKGLDTPKRCMACRKKNKKLFN